MRLRSFEWVLLVAPLSLVIGCEAGECVFEPSEDGFECPAPVEGNEHVAPADLPGCTSVWDGSYTCPQGLTQLTLSISRNPATNHLSALFSFVAPGNAPNTQGPSGCFTMVGEYDPESRSVSLRGDEWLCRPPLYFVVDLKGTYEPERLGLAGDVTTEGCTTFDLIQRPAF